MAKRQLGKKRLVDLRVRPLEKKVEEYLRKEVMKLGGKAFKFTSPANRSVPDRICFLPEGVLYLVEVKRVGGKLTKGQEQSLNFFRHLGFQTTTVWSIKDVDFVIKHMRETLRQIRLRSM